MSRKAKNGGEIRQSIMTVMIHHMLLETLRLEDGSGHFTDFQNLI